VYIEGTNCTSINILRVILQQKLKTMSGIPTHTHTCTAVCHNFQLQPCAKPQSAKENDNKDRRYGMTLHISFYTWTLALGVNSLPSEGWGNRQSLYFILLKAWSYDPTIPQILLAPRTLQQWYSTSFFAYRHMEFLFNFVPSKLLVCTQSVIYIKTNEMHYMRVIY
jgi:hypothetical protein